MRVERANDTDIQQLVALKRLGHQFDFTNAARSQFAAEQKRANDDNGRQPQ